MTGSSIQEGHLQHQEQQGTKVRLYHSVKQLMLDHIMSANSCF